MGKALYRKYRPTALADVIGQDQVVKPLQEAIKSGNFSHAYLFTGPRGCGKTSVARIFAHEVNNFKYELEDSYIDIIEIDAASNTGVDNVRELREKAIIAPTEAKYKVYIIDEVHMMSKPAFNALLKILEEPPEHVIFLLATTNPEKVPVTILSRVQNYVFKLANPEIMQEHLEKIAKKEKIDITPEAIKIIVARGGGSFRDSISLLDQISNISSSKITDKVVEEMLGIPEEERIKNLLSAYDAGDTSECVNELHEILDSGADAEMLAADLIDAIVKNPTPATLGLVDKLFDVQAPFANAKILVAFLKKDGATFAPAPQPVAKVAAPKPEPVVPKQEPKVEPEIVEEAVQEVEEAPAVKPEAPKEEPKPETPTVIKEISSEAFVSEVLAEDPALGSYMGRAVVVVNETTLDIYPSKPFDAKILEGKTELLRSHSRGRIITIHKHTEHAPHKSPAPKSENIDSISAIMGTVEEENVDDAPF